MNERPAGTDMDRIIASAQRLGVELDEVEAARWVQAVATAREDSDIVMDEDTGVFGHRVTMLDFSPQELAHFRRIGRLVEFLDSPGVETALALSGSAAQSKVQTYPGDCDYFERLNIHAPTRSEACRKLADLMRSKALSTMSGETYQLIEVKFGEYPTDVDRDGMTRRAGTPISWTAADIRSGRIEATGGDGRQLTIEWAAVASNPGWCKLDWVVADPVRGQVANASNMLDVTWEAPDGTITPLDGYLDPYFQEVYLEAESIPLFSKLAEHVSPDALAEYVDQLEGEVRKYVSKDPRNYGKAAKRMYNIFRLSGRYEEAAYLRELFDEPAALLYQAGALIRTLEEASEPGSTITVDTIATQLDSLLIDVVRVLEGPEEEEIVRQLLTLRDTLGEEGDLDERSHSVSAARAQLANLVNNFFHEKLTGLPAIATYIERIASGR